MVTLELPKAFTIVNKMNINDYFEPDVIEELEGNSISLADNRPPIISPYRNIYNEKKWHYFREMQDKAFKEYIMWLKQAPDFIKIVETENF